MALVDVIDKQSIGRIIIPPFITNTIQSSDVTNANRDVSPFNHESIGEYKNTMFYRCDSLKVLKQPESLSKK